MEKPKFKLLDYSNEILYEIFINLNDIELLNTTKVCKRFDAIATHTFVKRYNKNLWENSYEIKLYSDDSKDDQSFYRE